MAASVNPHQDTSTTLDWIRLQPDSDPSYFAQWLSEEFWGHKIIQGSMLAKWSHIEKQIHRINCKRLIIPFSIWEGLLFKALHQQCKKIKNMLISQDLLTITFQKHMDKKLVCCTENAQSHKPSWIYTPMQSQAIRFIHLPKHDHLGKLIELLEQINLAIEAKELCLFCEMHGYDCLFISWILCAFYSDAVSSTTEFSDGKINILLKENAPSLQPQIDQLKGLARKAARSLEIETRRPFIPPNIFGKMLEDIDHEAMCLAITCLAYEIQHQFKGIEPENMDVWQYIHKKIPHNPIFQSGIILKKIQMLASLKCSIEMSSFSPFEKVTGQTIKNMNLDQVVRCLFPPHSNLPLVSVRINHQFLFPSLQTEDSKDPCFLYFINLIQSLKLSQNEKDKKNPTSFTWTVINSLSVIQMFTAVQNYLSELKQQSNDLDCEIKITNYVHYERLTEKKVLSNCPHLNWAFFHSKYVENEGTWRLQFNEPQDETIVLMLQASSFLSFSKAHFTLREKIAQKLLKTYECKPQKENTTLEFFLDK